jgi:hypothetical protein
MDGEGGGGAASPPRSHHRVAVAVTAAKRARVLTPALAALGAAAGIEFVAVAGGGSGGGGEERSLPRLADLEPPPAAVLHKRPDDGGWAAELASFAAAHPDAWLLDPPAACGALRDRRRMLAPVAGGLEVRLSSGGGVCRFAAPPQAVAGVGDTAAGLLAALGCGPPLVAKPCATDGPGDAHSICLLPDAPALEAALRAIGSGGGEDGALLLLQPFVPHGTVLWKAYVLGPHVIVQPRRTLTVAAVADAPPGAPLPLGRISAFAASGIPPAAAEAADVADGWGPPPPDAVAALAAAYRDAFGLSLFNLDIIEPAAQHPSGLSSSASSDGAIIDGSSGGSGRPLERSFLVLDANYLPGFDKVLGAEAALVDFLSAGLSGGGGRGGC